MHSARAGRQRRVGPVDPLNNRVPSPGRRHRPPVQIIRSASSDLQLCQGGDELISVPKLACGVDAADQQAEPIRFVARESLELVEDRTLDRLRRPVRQTTALATDEPLDLGLPCSSDRRSSHGCGPEATASRRLPIRGSPSTTTPTPHGRRRGCRAAGGAWRHAVDLRPSANRRAIRRPDVRATPRPEERRRHASAS